MQWITFSFTPEEDTHYVRKLIHIFKEKDGEAFPMEWRKKDA